MVIHALIKMLLKDGLMVLQKDDQSFYEFILASMSDADMKAINSASFDEPIFVIDWKMPPGAKGDLVGPC